MLLDLNPKTGAFFLKVPRGEADIRDLMRGHGLDYSETRSTVTEAVLLTHSAYAAATFAEFASPVAEAALWPIVREIEASRSKSNDGNFAVPADQELWPFQRADLAYCLRRKHSLVGDQPGLGKTPVAICFANEIKARRVLVVVPANIRLQWARKIREWSTLAWPYVVYPILSSRRGVHPDAAWTIVSYDLLRSPAIAYALSQGYYDLIIMDEAHYAKESDAKRTRAIFGGGRRLADDPPPLITRCERLLALTGTPLPNRPREAFTLANGLCPDAIDFMGEEDFRERFNPTARETGERADGTKYVYVREESGRAGELQNRLRANFMTRHEKHGPEGVMAQLKPPVYDIVLMDETSAVKQALAAEKMLGLYGAVEDLIDSSDFEVKGHISRVRHQMGIAMAPLAADYCKMMLDGGEEKIFVFAWHIEVLNILERELHRYGLIRIDGSVSPTQRQSRVDHYVRDRNIRVAMGNIQSIGTGTDGLQLVCNRAVGAECSWVPGENQQVVDRLDRGGQQRTVYVDFLVAPGSISERVLASSLKKLDGTERALDRRFSIV